MDRQLVINEIVQDQQAMENRQTETRDRVLRIGRNLRKLQADQKKEQAETGQTWKVWCEDQKMAWPSFPEHSQGIRYMLISKYPGAYEQGMSIKEAYKTAGKWKKNGGNPPPKEKVTIKARPLITLGKACGKIHRKFDNLNDHESLADVAIEGNWDQQEIDGVRDEVILLRQDCTLFLKKLQALDQEIDLAEAQAS